MSLNRLYFVHRDGYRNRFVINIDETSCDNRKGFLTILINDTCAFNRSMKYPKILYSDSFDQPAFWNIDEGTPTTVNLDIFTRVLFSRNCFMKKILYEMPKSLCRLLI